MQTRKKITLPSGGTVFVRKICGKDFFRAGFIPKAFPELEAERKRQRVERKPVKPATAEEIDNGVKCTVLTLTQCTSRITMSDGSKLRIVDKELDECADDEITVGELSDADAQAIVEAINSFSGLTKEAASEAAPFPAEQTNVGDAAPIGEDVRAVAVETTGVTS